MSRRVVVATEFRDRIPADWARWEAAEGSPVALSRTTSTVLARFLGVPIYLKRHRYPLLVSLRAAFRHTLVRPSRPGREFRMLEAFREKAGEDVAPSPVAFGERRVLGFLREAFVASEAATGAAPVGRSELSRPGAAERLGVYLARLRTAGLIHGRLFARNLLIVPDGGYRVVDLDRARVRRFCAEGHGVSGFTREWASDLARLFESIADLGPEVEQRVLLGFSGGDGEQAKEWARTVIGYRDEARKQLERRSRLSPGARTSPSSS